MSLLTVTLDLLKIQPNYVRLRWNFRKANWLAFQSITDKLISTFFTALEEAVKSNIPRGRQLKYKPFWSTKLNNLKISKDKARIKAEQTGKPEDLTLWRKEMAKFKQRITMAKRNTWNSFLKTIDYRTDGSKAYKLINSLNNKYTTLTQNPIFTKEEVTDPKKIAMLFNTYYDSNKLSNDKRKADKKCSKKK